MLEKDINELLQDYKYRKNILEEITLTDIDKWNNIDVDVGWTDILNKPTDLEGYGLKTEIKENTLNKFSAVNGNFPVNLGFNIKYGDYSIFGIQTDAVTGAPTPEFGMQYDNEMYSYVSAALGNLNLIASDSVYLDTPHFNLKTPWFYVSTEYGTFDVDLKNANAEIFTNVPFRTEKPIKVPKLDILNSSSTREGMLYNSTYKVNDVVHDGIHLRHEDGKYLVLGHLDSTAGENGTVYSYMICDVDGVLKNESDGDEWGPIRFEQNVFFRHGLRISSGEPLIINNYNVATKIASIESAIETGTGMVQWGNVLNKPSTFTPSSHTHDYLPLSGGTMNGSLKFGEADGRGINFWNSGLYSIYMSSADNATYGGRLWETASDYNMYFRMGTATHGFVFKNNNGILGGMDGSGIFRAVSAIATKNIYFGGTVEADKGYIENGELTFANGKGIYGKDTNGTAQRIAVVGSDNCCYLGGVYLHTYIRSSDNPQYLTQDGKKYNLFHEGYTQKWMSAYNSSTVSSDITTPQLLYTGPISKDKSGLFPAITNANSILNIGRHNKEGGCFESQLGFSSNGRLYYRIFENQNPSSNPTKSWNTIAFSSDLSAYALLGHQHDFIASMGRSAPKTGRNARRGVYCYTTSGADSTSTGMPTGYCTVIGFGDGDGGCAEIAISYTGNGMWYRYLRDWQDNWSSWVQIK